MDLRQLLAHPGVHEECTLRSGIGIMALHGGSQDRGTDHIARAVAARTGSSLYAIIQGGVRVHLTSRRHEPEHSPAGGLPRPRRHRHFGARVRPGRLLAPHGRRAPPRPRALRPGPARGADRTADRHHCRRARPRVVPPGRALLHDRLPGYHVADERVRLGFHPQNPVNLPRHQGVQVELPPGLRGIGPYGERTPTDPGDIPDALIAGTGRAGRGGGGARRGGGAVTADPAGTA